MAVSEDKFVKYFEEEIAKEGIRVGNRKYLRALGRAIVRLLQTDLETTKLIKEIYPIVNQFNVEGEGELRDKIEPGEFR